MTILVRVKAEGVPPGKALAVNLVDKKTKKVQLYTKLISNGEEAVVSVYDNQDVQLREADA